jgi:hypothetical protein
MICGIQFSHTPRLTHWRGAFTLNYFHYCCCCYYYFGRWRDLRPAMMLCVYITRTVGFTLLRRVQSHKSHTTFPFLVFFFLFSFRSSFSVGYNTSGLGLYWDRLTQRPYWRGLIKRFLLTAMTRCQRLLSKGERELDREFSKKGECFICFLYHMKCFIWERLTHTQYQFLSSVRKDVLQ